MSFLSISFALFLGISLLIFHLSPARARPIFLLIFSYAFYSTWSWSYTLLLVCVTTGVYGTALWVEQRPSEQEKCRVLAVGVMTLVLFLFGFKLLEWWRHQLPEEDLSVRLLVPLGISYYVFKLLGYLLDVYWETIPAQRSFTAVALYASFFPQIVSGPIQRAPSFFDQLPQLAAPDPALFQSGLRRILLGLFKKIVVADNLAILVDRVHSDPWGFSALELLLGAYAFSFQLYMDFGGLTDLALGVGMLFGLRGPENFALPYYARNIQDFWRRWHMSLTTWLTEYLYTPLRMSLRKLGNKGLSLAIMINMLAIGLWHGFTWTFFVFGLVNGIYMIVSALTLKPRDHYFRLHPRLSRCRKYLGPLLTFHLVVATHILFRAESLSSAAGFFRVIVGGHSTSIYPLRLETRLLGLPVYTLLACVLAIACLELVTWAALQPRGRKYFFDTPIVLHQFIYASLAIIILLSFKESVSFIYARF